MEKEQNNEDRKFEKVKDKEGKREENQEKEEEGKEKQEEKKLGEKTISEEKTEEELMKERKKKLLAVFKNKNSIILYIALLILVFIGANIRTQNLYGLKDITTGNWTLGPDLDPFLFLRWAKYIVENGSLMANDTMRYVTIGFNTAYEMKLLSYLIAWFYKITSMFSPKMTVDHAAVIFPIFFFILTTIAFFLFVKKVFEDNKHRNLITIVSTALFVVLPSLLSRTIAGIPEKESVGFFFLFLAFYFFLASWKAKKTNRNLVFGALSGISTTLMALIWGGVMFIFLTISLATFIAFLLNKMEKKQFFAYFLWFLVSLIPMMIFSPRYTPINLITATSTIPAFGVFFIIIIDKLIYWKFSNLSVIKKLNKKLPERVVSLIVSIILLFIIVIIFFGPNFIIQQIKEIIERLIHPFATDRWSLTVAENRQPYFGEWKSSFGPIIRGIPLFFWLFFVGSIVLFHEGIKKLRKKEGTLLTISYTIFLFCLVFSRYSQDNIMNGVSSQSKLVYFLGMFILAGTVVYTYYKYFKEDKLGLFKEINFSYILVLVLFFLTLVAARGGVRLIMVLAPAATITIGYLSAVILPKAREKKDELSKFIFTTIAIIVIISTFYTFYVYYMGSRASARGFVPSQYTWQWQKAMAWVRQNTSENAVFAHWWDYGYWVQSIGNRATVLDGGNSIVYWNYLMGRYVLTGKNKKDALEYLYTHKATHLLIDSTDIGKYPAYSSIGSDQDYDRYSWIPTFLINSQFTKETRNTTQYLYQGGFMLDKDFIFTENGKQVFFPAGSSGVGGILLTIENTGEILQPEAIFVYQGKQQNIQIRYIFYKDKLHDFKTGYEAGIVIIPKLKQEGQGLNIDEKGAAIFLSPRVADTLLAKLYFFNESADGSFKLVHNEPSWLIQSLRDQGLSIGDFAFFNAVQGPIKIWEINYPENIKENPEFLETKYPNETLRMSRGTF